MEVHRNLNDSTAVTVLFMMVSGERAWGFHTIFSWCFPSFFLSEDLAHVIFTYFQCKCGERGFAGGVYGCVERCSGWVWGVFFKKLFKS